MRRITVPVLAAMLVFGATLVADAVRPARLGEDVAELQQTWTSWLLGSGSDPLLSGSCGEVVDDRFFLTVALEPEPSEIDCEVPAGTELVASPAGAFSYEEPGVLSDTELFRDTLGVLRGVKLKSVKVLVDDVRASRGPLTCPSPFDIDLEPGNGLQQLDPSLDGDTARVSICAWLYALPGFSSGEHTIRLLAAYKGGVKFDLTFNVTVV
jgi:hypothetical protein